MRRVGTDARADQRHMCFWGGGLSDIHYDDGAVRSLLAYLSSLPIWAVVYRFCLPFLPSYPPTYRFTTIYRFLPIFSRIYRILIFSTDLFVISCKLCSHKCYFHVLMVTSVKKILYLDFQATCNVLAQWVKCRWLVVAHFLPQGNFQMLTGMCLVYLRYVVWRLSSE